MGRYIARRILIAIPVFLLVTVIVFAFMRLSPGEPEVIALTREISPSQAEELRRELNLHRALPVQYGYWISDFVRGDLGKSDLHEFRVGSEIQNRLPNTLKLAALAIFTALVLGIPIGILSAVKADRPADYTFRGAAVLALSIPSFWLAILAITVPANLWGIGPPLRFIPWGIDPWSHFTFFLLPGILLGFYLVGITLRMTRAMMLEVLTSDYIRTARAKGLHEAQILVRHALRNVLIPIITIIGAQAGWLVGGSVVIETIFSIPGVGAMMFDAVLFKDFQVVQGVTVFLAAFVLAINLLIDITYGILDPRIRLG